MHFAIHFVHDKIEWCSNFEYCDVPKGCFVTGKLLINFKKVKYSVAT